MSRRVARLAWRFAAAATSLGLAVVFGFTLYAVGALPPLERWHTDRLHEEFTAFGQVDLDFEGYQRLEERLFAELERTIAGWDPAMEPLKFSRFYKGSPLNRLAGGTRYNRSFRLTPARPVGSALLIHGLTDSPYSMKALADTLHARGFEVTVLRLPGHGTLPSMMVRMSTRDWTAAVRMAARDVAARTPSGRPFYIGGYSTGGTLSLLYALDALEDSTLRKPDRVLLVSPAVALTQVARLAEVIDLFSVVPIPVLEKVRWQQVMAEYDPFKFNSFPVNAARQVNRATRSLSRSLASAVESGRIARLPSVITWQSAVDASVGATGVVDSLYARLPDARHRLVMFDVNRIAVMNGVQRPEAGALIARLHQMPRRYTLDIVTNARTGDERVDLERSTPDGTRATQETGFSWPAGLVSLSHVALPFPPDDPVYGFIAGSGREGIPSIGSWLVRGENGATTIALGSLTRLRSNPFWALIQADVDALVSADLAVPR
ncbi:MAG: alpha/beta fold hydrolase [Betaproteobacteria bacterium]|nr:alpha/beta fold hydrolase [Betaproteobacteria bacterium]